MKTLRYKKMKPGQLISRLDERWCPVSKYFRVTLDDMKRFSRNYRRLTPAAIATGLWRRPIKPTQEQATALARRELAKINATRKRLGWSEITAK